MKKYASLSSLMIILLIGLSTDLYGMDNMEEDCQIQRGKRSRAHDESDSDYDDYDSSPKRRVFDVSNELYEAILEDNQEIVLGLLEHYVVGGNNAFLPLHVAIKNTRRAIISLVISYFKEKNNIAALNEVDSDGRTPLHIAVLFGDEAIIYGLLETRLVDSSKKDLRGFTAHDYALQQDNSSTIIDLFTEFFTQDDVAMEYEDYSHAKWSRSSQSFCKFERGYRDWGYI